MFCSALPGPTDFAHTHARAIVLSYTCACVRAHARHVHESRLRGDSGRGGVTIPAEP